MRRLTYAQALLEAQRQLLEADERVLILGEGVDDCGGVFGSTLGLARDFPDRVLDTPISENGMTGVAMGAAAAGLRPVLVHMRADFLPMSMDQLANHAAKWNYMTAGQVSVPLVVRSVIGRGWGSAAQHSQGLHGLFMAVPGLKVALPATPHDAKGLLLAAARDPNPVLLFEHRWLYALEGDVPPEPYTVPLGRAVVRREGTDATVAAVSLMVKEAWEAARELEAAGVSAEVIDLRSIAPLDMEAVIRSVRKTGRLVVADCACRAAGLGAEIACRLAETDPGLLRAPVKRVCFPDLPTPASSVLEAAYYPGAADIRDAVLHLVRP